MRSLKKTLSLLLTLCLLFSAIGILPITATEADAIAEEDGYVWVVRTYHLKVSDFSADSSVLIFQFEQFNFAASPANITFDRLDILCDDVQTDSISINRTYEKGAATSNFGANGSVAIAKGDHQLTFKIRVKVTDADPAQLGTNIAPFFFWGPGLISGVPYWVIDGVTNNITLSEMITGTAGYNDPEEAEPKKFVRVSRSFRVTEEQYTGESGMLNFNGTLNFSGTAPADIEVKALEIVCDGRLIQTVNLSHKVEKGAAVEAATTNVSPWNTVEVAKGDHIFTFTFVFSVENPTDSWLGESNGFFYQLWSPAIQGGAGLWVTAGSTMISVKEMMNGTQAPTMLEGASVRLNEQTGLRFETQLSRAYYDALVVQYGADNVTVGTLIAPAVYVKEAGAFTTEALDALNKSSAKYLDVVADGFYAEDADAYTLAGSVVNVKEKNYQLEFAAIGYVEVNGVRTYAANFVVRSISEVATAALADTKTEQNEEYAYAVEGQSGLFSPYTTEQRVLLTGFCS